MSSASVTLYLTIRHRRQLRWHASVAYASSQVPRLAGSSRLHPLKAGSFYSCVAAWMVLPYVTVVSSLMIDCLLEWVV